MLISFDISAPLFYIISMPIVVHKHWIKIDCSEFSLYIANVSSPGAFVSVCNIHIFSLLICNIVVAYSNVLNLIVYVVSAFDNSS
jgi:hypothetical protein